MDWIYMLIYNFILLLLMNVFVVIVLYLFCFFEVYCILYIRREDNVCFEYVILREEGYFYRYIWCVLYDRILCFWLLLVVFVRGFYIFMLVF